MRFASAAGAPASAISLKPGISEVLTIFYYRDLPAAVRWYEEKLGFERLATMDEIVIFRVAGGSQLALVGAGAGSQEPIDGRNKGAILSIQTDDLEDWHALLFARGVEGTGKGLQVGCSGRTVEFKAVDPEGYTVEFFEWL